MTTTVPADVNTLSGVPQSWQSLNIGVYQRKGATIQIGEQNYFSDSYPDSGISFEDGCLRLHFIPPRVGLPSVDLDLVQQPGKAWVGRLHRGDFDSQVKLLRLGVGGRLPIAPIAGTWSENSMPVRSCVHIVQQTPTEFTGWSDSLQVLGSAQFANHLPRPATAMERYGELMKVHREEGGRISFELGAFSAACCSHVFLGALTPEGTLIQGRWPAGPNQAPHPGSWRKMPGDSCISPGRAASTVQH